MKQSARCRAIVLVLTAGAGCAFATLTGCGSGMDRSTLTSAGAGVSAIATVGTGRAAITIRWPARAKASSSRLIPEASNSIVVQMLRTVGGTTSVVQTQTVARPADPTDGSAPTSTVTFSNLPIDTFSVVATAYPTSTATGTAQASGTGSVTTTADGDTATFSVTMGSTIDHIDLSPANPTVAINKALALAATAWNGPNEATASIVLLSPGKLTWSASNATVSVNNNGLVTAGATPGTSTVTVTDGESGKSANVPVAVSSSPDSVGPAQFNPNGIDYAGTLKDSTGAPYSGGWTASGDNYFFDSKAAMLTDTTKGQRIATGILVTQTFGTARASVTYAVFDFPKDINLGNGSMITGTGVNPVVLLTRGNFTLSGTAKINFSGILGQTPCGGESGGGGPGAGGNGNSFGELYSGGGSFVGRGGGPGGAVYGSDFVAPSAPHFQGGSGGSGDSTSDGSGGALYVASVGVLTIANATIRADGDGSHEYGGGSGGGIALFGAGGVSFSQTTLSASGGQGVNYEGYAGCGGGGGVVAVGSGPGVSPPDVSFVTVLGGAGGIDTHGHYENLDGTSGAVIELSFGGF